MKKKPDEMHITIRFPDDVIDKLREIAPVNGRSLKSEVVQAVREYLKRQATKR